MDTKKRKKKRGRKKSSRMPLSAAQRRLLKLMERTGGVAYAYLRKNGAKCYRIRTTNGDPVTNVQERVLDKLKSKGYLVHLKKGGYRPPRKRKPVVAKK